MSTNKKYFSLIYGAELHQAPNAKVLSSEAFSDLLTSQELISRIHEEAEKYRQEVIAECETLKIEAQKEGFESGFQEWVEHVAKLEAEIENVHQELQKLVMPIALKAAKKIVSTELATSPEAILSIVMNTLKTVAQHKKIVLYVNKADFEVLDSNKSKIKALFEALESLSIRERDDIEQGGCVIETESGIINAQLKDRWINLEVAFQAIAEQIRKGSKG